MKSSLTQKKVQSADENSSGYYIRLNVKDQPGILGSITAVFGRHNVSILTVNQDVKSNENVSLVFITHEALEGNIAASVEEIKNLNNVNGLENLIRIENFR